LLAAIAVTVLDAGSDVHAQTYPNRAIRMIAAFPTGGGSDIVTRVIAQKLAETMGQQVVVENRAGAAGNIGTEAVARAAPDGYTLGMGNSASLGINASLYKNLPYNPVTDFAPITQVASYTYVVVSRSAFPPKSFRELVAYAKDHPGKVNFASSGSTTKLAGALLKSMAGIEMTDIPFNGGGPAQTQLLGGHVDIMMAAALNLLLPHVKAGTLRPLAVTAARRSPELPDVPTIAESGIPGFDVSVWYGIVAPAGTPQEIVTRLSTQIVQILKLPDVRERIVSTGSTIVGSTPEQFAAVIASEVTKWAKVVRESGATAE